MLIRTVLHATGLDFTPAPTVSLPVQKLLSMCCSVETETAVCLVQNLQLGLLSLL